MSTQAILDQIDAAVEDWAVGPDAMRMNPTTLGLCSPRPIAITFDATRLQSAVESMQRAMDQLATVFKNASPALKAMVDQIAYAERAQAGAVQSRAIHTEYHRRSKARRKRNRR